jgi:hypothetical protein
MQATWTDVELPKILTLTVVRLEVPTHNLLQKAGDVIAILVCSQTCLQYVICRRETIKDETNLVRPTRDVVVGPVGINDLQPVWLVIVILEGTVACL